MTTPLTAKSLDLPSAPAGKTVLDRSQSQATAACRAAWVQCRRQTWARQRARHRRRSVHEPAVRHPAQLSRRMLTSVDGILATAHSYTTIVSRP